MTSKRKRHDISIIIPAYNEEDRIKPVLENCSKRFPASEIIVVCDGNDTTPDIVKRMSEKSPRIKLLHFTTKQGKGRAIIKGLKKAEGNIIGFIDADESISLDSIERLVSLPPGTDGLIASRRHRESKIDIKQPFYRKVASNSFNLIVRTMFSLPYRDTQCGAKFFRKEAIDSIIDDMKCDGFEFDVELLWRLQLKKYIVKELPVNWNHSEGSSFSMNNAPGMFLSLVNLRMGK